ncbi:cytochrome b5-like [Gossypium australe]|uniref:Cytochrome b5-like n=2 Tax=Gossypium TaxID=3633 RepID=A0A5B6U9K5_9ROSI|nr:cytochrome b5-like [Gossypium australe]
MGGDGKVFTLAQVSEHNTPKDCWLIINDKVYDVTKYLKDHPGGDEVLLSATGKDATDDFEDVGHSDSARDMLDQYYVGEIDISTIPTKTTYKPPNRKMVGDGKMFTLAQVSEHNTPKDCWLIINGKVYDVTKFLEDHPGGDEVLLSATGKDATDDFEDVGHSDSARDMMDQYYVGEIDTSTIPKKTTYKPPNQPDYNQDKTSEFIIKLLQFLVPLAILCLAVGIHHYTKSS